MAGVSNIEYMFSVNKHNTPKTVTGKAATALKIARLILLEPGSDPLHPEMGVGIRKYRHGQESDIIGKISKEVDDQIMQYLPEYQYAHVDFIITDDRILNFQITVDDEIFIYESANTETPIFIEDLRSN